MMERPLPQSRSVYVERTDGSEQGLNLLLVTHWQTEHLHSAARQVFRLRVYFGTAVAEYEGEEARLLLSYIHISAFPLGERKG